MPTICHLPINEKGCSIVDYFLVSSMECVLRVGRPLAVNAGDDFLLTMGKNKSSMVVCRSTGTGGAPMVTCRSSTLRVKAVFSLTPPVVKSTSKRGGAAIVSSNVGWMQGLDSPPAPTVSTKRNLFTTSRCPQ